MAEPLPPSVRELCADRKRVIARYPPQVKLWRLSRRSPSLMARLFPSLVVPPFPQPTALFTIRCYDTSVACFYRIYEFAVIHDDIRFRNEIEYFCHQPWPIKSLPDPRDFDPERAAFLAALTHILCASFNARIEMGLPRDAPAYIADFDALRAQPKILEKPPRWVEKTPPLRRPIRINAHELPGTHGNHHEVTSLSFYLGHTAKGNHPQAHTFAPVPFYSAFNCSLYFPITSSNAAQFGWGSLYSCAHTTTVSYETAAPSFISLR
ncbi:hypothetical protein B0H11DRAFT_2138242 [Mycena galericulata]|nr:hypothetical protein B0H11DRAFT_2138242 [Mycena galericulata]